jgi:hypothetical protein
MQFRQKRTAAMLVPVVLSVLVLLAPTSSATPAGTSHGASNATRDLASDPSGFPPANYSNPQIEPNPAVPHTTPVVLNLSAYGSVPLPWGDWETVVLNYTGYTAGTAYDYFQTVTIDGAMVYVGVNPEAGHWTQFINMSEYLAFFDDRASMNISGPHLGPGTNFEGVQSNYLTFLFYPIPTGAPGPSYANLVEPLFQFNGDPSTATISIPANTSAIELQMMAIGSEFWYSLNPDFTAVTVSIGGYNVSTYLQYPWINSGGIDLFSWRPIYPVNMLDHQWEYFNLTAALGLIEGASTLTASPATGSLSADVIANLLIYTNPHVTGAKSLEYGFDQAPVRTYDQVNQSYDNGNPNGNDYSVFNQFDRVAYHYASRVQTASGSYTVSLSTSEQYANLQSLTLVWQNITENEILRTTQSTDYNERGMHGQVTADQILSYPLAMDLGTLLAYLYSIGPDAYYNYTSFFYHVTQGYEELDSWASDVDGVRASSVTALSDAIIDTNGFFASVLEIGPGFAIILNVTSSLHTTTKLFELATVTREGNSLSGSYYLHLLSGREDNSTTYYVEENLTRDLVIALSFSHHGGRYEPEQRAGRDT